MPGTLPPIGAEVPQAADPRQFGTRADGSRKGTGFLGVLTRPDGSVSSEISIGVNIDGKEVEIPTLVPTLTPQERDWLIKNDVSDPSRIPPSIIQKAVEYAKPRIASGRSPFAQDGELPPIGAEVPQAPTFRSTNAKTASGEAEVDPNTLGTFASHYGAQVNPVTAARGLAQSIDHPIQFLKSWMSQNGDLAQKAMEAYRKGDYLTSARHWVDYTLNLVPGAGATLDQAADQMQAGHYMAGLGDTLGFATMMFGPKALSEAIKSRTTPQAQQTRPALTPQEQASNDFARQERIPLDAATATGSRTMRAVEKRVANSMGGEGTADRLIGQQQQGLTRAGRSLAAQTGAVGTTPEAAGGAVRNALTKTVQAHEARATAAYTRAEPVAAKVPFDLDAIKPGLKPMYEALKREAELVPLQGGKARALVALDRLMNGPNTVSLMDAERATSDLGAMAGSDLVRTPGQGVAAAAFGRLRSAVNAAAKKAGVLDALEEGRAATTQKYVVNEVLDSLQTEPVQAYRKLAAPKDTNVALLRQVQQHAPAAVPEIARGYLETVLDTATERRRFDHADKLYAEWQKLGPETKKVLFPDLAMRSQLDHFFLLAKRVAENPNPSGTAHTLTALNFGSVPVTWGLAKLLYTPKGVRALTALLAAPSPRALLPSGQTVATAAQVAATGRVLEAAREAGLPVPAASDRAPGQARRVR